MHIYIKKYLISSVVVEKLLWPQNRVIFVDFDPDRLYDSARIIQRLRNHITDDHLNDISIVYLGLLSPLR